MPSPPGNSSWVSIQSTRPSLRAMKPSRLAAMWIVTRDSSVAMLIIPGPGNGKRAARAALSECEAALLLPHHLEAAVLLRGLQRLAELLLHFVAAHLHRRRHHAVVDGPGVLGDVDLGHRLVRLERGVDLVHGRFQLLLHLVARLLPGVGVERDHHDRLEQAGPDQAELVDVAVGAEAAL